MFTGGGSFFAFSESHLVSLRGGARTIATEYENKATEDDGGTREVSMVSQCANVVTRE